MPESLRNAPEFGAGRHLAVSDIERLIHLLIDKDVLAEKLTLNKWRSVNSTLYAGPKFPGSFSLLPSLSPTCR
jgi:hypothetical protein